MFGKHLGVTLIVVLELSLAFFGSAQRVEDKRVVEHDDRGGKGGDRYADASKQ